MVAADTTDTFVTKWGYRFVLLYLAYAACQWLDTIKVRRVGRRVLMAGQILTPHL